MTKNKKILEDFDIIKKELEHSEQRKHKKLIESHLDKEDMEIYYDHNQSFNGSSLSRANKLENSLLNLDLKLTQGLEMLKKDYETIKF